MAAFKSVLMEPVEPVIRVSKGATPETDRRIVKDRDSLAKRFRAPLVNLHQTSVSAHPAPVARVQLDCRLTRFGA